MSDPYYAAQLDLRGKQCVVVGAGKIARRKAEALTECGGTVTVVAPTIDPEIRQLPSVLVVEREYQADDLEDVWLVIAATDDEDVNAAVARDAAARHIWANVVDNPAWSSFILPAVLRRGPIAIGVSTAGASPALAAKVRDAIGDAVDPAYGAVAELLAELRPRVLAAVADPKARSTLLLKMASDEVVDCARQKGREAAATMLEGLLDQALFDDQA